MLEFQYKTKMVLYNNYMRKERDIFKKQLVSTPSETKMVSRQRPRPGSYAKKFREGFIEICKLSVEALQNCHCRINFDKISSVKRTCKKNISGWKEGLPDANWCNSCTGSRQCEHSGMLFLCFCLLNESYWLKKII